MDQQHQQGQDTEETRRFLSLMDQQHQQGLDSEETRRFLSLMAEVGSRTTQSLDYDYVLRGVLDSARLLTGATSGVLTLNNDKGRIADHFSSRLTPEEVDRFLGIPQSQEVLKFLSGIAEPLRLANLTAHLHAQGFTEWQPPRQTDGPTFMAVPIYRQGFCTGHIFMNDKEGGGEFTQFDEDSLVVFAAHAGMVIANARAHRDERKARESLDMLIDLAPVGIVVLDARTGALERINDEGSRILRGLWDGDQPPDDLLESLTFAPPQGRECSPQELPLAELLRAGKAVRAKTVALRGPDAPAASVLVNASPFQREDGRTESFILVLQDMAPLEEQERLRAEFIGMVSNELRAPLAAIKGSIATLLDSADELDPVEMAWFHGMIRDRTDQMRRLVSNFLDVASIETGSLPVDPEPVDVYALVDRSRAQFLDEDTGNHLEVELADGLPMVMADRRRISQVLSTLLSSASRYSPGGLPIRLTAEREGVHVAISVSGGGGGYIEAVL